MSYLKNIIFKIDIEILKKVLVIFKNTFGFV